MTEADWRTCADPAAMLQFLRFKCGVRKLRLFTVACYRREWHLLDERARTAVEFAERLANDRDRIAARGLRTAKADADGALHAAMRAVGSTESGHAAQAGLLRDVFGPLPFRAVAIDAPWLAWKGGTVVQLATAIYEERRWEDIAVLGDALQDAGCDNDDILSHCQSKGPHARGCLLVDAILRTS
jgi:hypothetical protein